MRARNYLLECGSIAVFASLTFFSMRETCVEAQERKAIAQALPDVVGFRTGMSVQEAYGKLKAYMPKGHVDLDNITIPEIGEKPLPYRMTVSEYGPGPSPETISMGVLLPPNKQVVWMVARQIFKMPGQQAMSRTNIVAALKEKYGRPDFEQINEGGARLTWLYDTQGRRETENKPPASPCVAAPVLMNSPNISMGIPREPSPTFPQDSTHGWLRCKNMVYVTAVLARDTTHMESAEYVSSFTVAVGDGSLVTHGADATAEAIENFHLHREEQDLKKLDKQAAPKL